MVLTTREDPGTSPGVDPLAVAPAPVTAKPVRRPRLLPELALLAVAYSVYARIRDVHGEDTSPVAFSRAVANGGRITRFERASGLYHELGLQRFALNFTLVVRVSDVFYATAHVLVTTSVLVWLFIAHPGRYRRARTALLIMTGGALIVFWLFPTAPPRMMPNAGFADTLFRVGGLLSSRTPAIEHILDLYAAMPSLHAAWATFCTLAVLPSCRRVWSRCLVISYPVIVALVVVVTGNHYFMDVLAGVVVALLAWSVTSPSLIQRLHRLHLRRRPSAALEAGVEAGVEAGALTS